MTKAITRRSHLLSFMGLILSNNRKVLWEYLSQTGPNVTNPWLILGDFSSPFDVTCRNNGAAVSLYEIEDGVNTIKNLHLCSPNTTGPFFSWRKSEREDDI